MIGYYNLKSLLQYHCAFPLQMIDMNIVALFRLIVPIRW